MSTCNTMSLGTGIIWQPELVSTSSATFTVRWPIPRVTPVNGCEITSYRMELSKTEGPPFDEIDSSLVREKPNLLEHTLAVANFEAADLGKTCLVRVIAVNVAGTLTSSTLAVLLADAPATPTIGPQLD